MIPDYGQMEFSRKEKFLFGIGMLFFLGVVSQMFYQNLVLLFLFPLLYRKGMALYADYKVNKRKRQFLLEFRDFLFSLSTSFATGRHILDGLRDGARYVEEIHGKHGVLQKELWYIIKAIEETGASDFSLLSDLAKRINLEDVYLFIDVFGACRETGGDLASSMHKSAFVISEKISLEQEIKTMVAQKKLEGRMITAMPFVMICFLQCVSPGYLEVMYTTVGGRCLMTIGLIMMIFAFLWMERMTNVEL